MTRWKINPYYECDGVMILTVCTPKGTGRKAVGVSFIHKACLENRVMLAKSIREARNAAVEFRRRNTQPKEKA